MICLVARDDGAIDDQAAFLRPEIPSVNNVTGLQGVSRDSVSQARVKFFAFGGRILWMVTKT